MDSLSNFFQSSFRDPLEFHESIGQKQFQLIIVHPLLIMCRSKCQITSHFLSSATINSLSLAVMTLAVFVTIAHAHLYFDTCQLLRLQQVDLSPLSQEDLKKRTYTAKQEDPTRNPHVSYGHNH